MTQCCGKIPTKDDIQQIRDSVIKSQQSDAVKLGSHHPTRKISPYNPGEVIQIETYNEDGSIHYTTVNSETGVRHSYTILPDGTVVEDHTTNQNVPKGDKDRHK